MKIKFIDWIYGILAFLPLIVTDIVFPAFPNTIPAHFNASGQVDRYGSKGEFFIFPIVIIVIALFFLLFFTLLNKSTEHKNSKLLSAAKISVILVFNVVDYGILVLTYNNAHSNATPDIFKFVGILLGFADIAIANYLPKCRQNGWAGIRTPWTLVSESVWYKTHRFGGWLLAIGGIVCIVVSMLLKGIACLYVVLAGDMLMIVVLMLYSYFVFQKQTPKTDKY